MQPSLPLKGQSTEVELQFRRLCMMHQESGFSDTEPEMRSVTNEPCRSKQRCGRASSRRFNHCDNQTIARFDTTACTRKPTNRNTNAAHGSREPHPKIMAHIQLKDCEATMQPNHPTLGACNAGSPKKIGSRHHKKSHH